jgi:hypothetical protein
MVRSTSSPDLQVAALDQGRSPTEMRGRLGSEIMRMPFIYSAAVTGASVNFSPQQGRRSKTEQRRSIPRSCDSSDNVLYVGRPFVGHGTGQRFSESQIADEWRSCRRWSYVCQMTTLRVLFRSQRRHRHHDPARTERRHDACQLSASVMPTSNVGGPRPKSARDIGEQVHYADERRRPRRSSAQVEGT